MRSYFFLVPLSRYNSGMANDSERPKSHDIIGSRLKYRMSFDPFKCELLHVNKIGKITVILAYQ